MNLFALTSLFHPSSNTKTKLTPPYTTNLDAGADEHVRAGVDEELESVRSTFSRLHLQALLEERDEFLHEGPFSESITTPRVL